MHKKHKLILVISYDRYLGELLAFDLHYLGYSNIIQAVDGKEGVELIKAHNPDLVITELTMPGKRGETVLRWIIRVHKPLHRIKSIAMSDDGMATTEATAMAAGCDVFLPKSYELEHLRTAVVKLLA